jgi:hypothetical protein
VIPLGHAGGGDELLLVLVPILVFMAVFRLVRGRVDTPADPGSRGEAS